MALRHLVIGILAIAATAALIVLMVAFASGKSVPDAAREVGHDAKELGHEAGEGIKEGAVKVKEAAVEAGQEIKHAVK